jgi:hypothetical protein|tara:strand:- start:540 stop:797 length:258 start_codon:yes stop_codon:yes gene_type:complete
MNVIAVWSIMQTLKKFAYVIIVNVVTEKRIKRMNKLFLILALFFALSACSVGKKCTYTQDGTKISSWIWFYGKDKPIDLDNMNCN